MGIILNLIDARAPGGFEIIVDSASDRRNRKMRIIAGESMVSVARRVCEEYRPYTVDVIRICSHGTPFLPDIQFGERLGAYNAVRLAPIHSRWRVVYSRVLATRPMREYIPRVEMHVCGASVGPAQMCRALADALRAPVFAASQDQEAGSTWVIEGNVTRFEPYMGRPRLTS